MIALLSGFVTRANFVTWIADESVQCESTTHAHAQPHTHAPGHKRTYLHKLLASKSQAAEFTM